VWETASKNASEKSEYTALTELTKQIGEAGAQVIDVDFPSADLITSPNGWDWEYMQKASPARNCLSSKSSR
jgi:amidase